MKTKLLLITCLLTSLSAIAQVVAGQEDDFEDGTSQSWTVGNPIVAENQISLPADGGPDGAGDQFFRYTTTGAPNGQGSRCLVFSVGAQWTGNYISEGIVAIKMDVRAIDRDLTLRIGFSDETSLSFLPTTQIVTSPIIVPAGSGWQEVTFPISPSDFIILPFGDGATAQEVLENVAEMRIFSQTLDEWIGEAGIPGDPTPRSMDLDNIEASTTLSNNEDFDINEFAISPNPATTKLNLSIPQSSGEVSVAVFDVLGKQVYSQNIGNITSKSIDVSNWNSGVYLVRLFSDNGSQTKRFVKQ